MKVVLDASVLVSAYAESSADHLLFLEQFVLLNQRASHMLVLCVSDLLLEDYRRQLGEDGLAREHYRRWMRQVGDLDCVYWKAACLEPMQESMLRNYACVDPVEHEILALALKSEKKIVAAMQNRLAQQKQYLTREQVREYLRRWGISVQDVIAFRVYLSGMQDYAFFGRQLKELMKDAFDMNELKELCFDLDATNDLVDSATKVVIIMEIIEYFRRHGKLEVLLNYLKEKRPNLSWPSASMLSHQTAWS